MDKLLKQIKAHATPTVIFSDINEVCKVLAMEGVPSGTYAVGARLNRVAFVLLETEADNLQLAIRHTDFVFKLPLIKTGFRGSYSLCVCMPGCGPTDFEVFKMLWNRTHGYELQQFEDEDGNRVKLERPLLAEPKDSKPILSIKGTTCSKKVNKSQDSESSSPPAANASDEEEVTRSTQTEEVLDKENSSSSDESQGTTEAKDSPGQPTPSENHFNESSCQNISDQVNGDAADDVKAKGSGQPSQPENSNSKPTKAVRPVMSESVRNERNLLQSLLPKSVPVIQGSAITLGTKVGEGRFSVVHEARLPTGELVAAKKMKPGLMESPLFDRQVRALAALRHPSVLSLVGVCLDGERLMILTKYLERGSLHNYLRGPNVKSHTPRELVRMARQVATGMEYISGEGWLHGNLASKNILLSSALECKIAGFETASPPTDQHYSVSHAHSYAAAVEVHQDKAFTSKSDVWSFGILFMEIMSRGETPYRGRVHPSQLKVYLEIGNRWKRPDCVSYEHYAIMQRCWRLKPRARPSFQQLVTDLRM